MQQEINILVDGKPLRQIAHNGKIFVVAKEGMAYEIRLRNHATSRIVGVTSVDGINVVDGEPAVERGTGYIINGYGSYNIKGFRTSNEEVHQFIFDKKKESYAANSENGSIEDCGVIGATFWAEKLKAKEIIKTIVEHHHHDHYPRYRKPFYPYWDDFYCGGTLGGSSYTTGNLGNASTFTMSCAPNQMQATNQNQGMLRSANMNQLSQKPVEFDMGTQFSESVLNDQVQTIDFEYGARLGSIEIHYASREALKQMGVPTERENAVTFPQAFKGSGFCKPPTKRQPRLRKTNPQDARAMKNRRKFKAST